MMKTKLIGGLAIALAVAAHGQVLFTNIYFPGTWPVTNWWTNSSPPSSIVASNAWQAENENWRRSSNVFWSLQSGTQPTNNNLTLWSALSPSAGTVPINAATATAAAGTAWLTGNQTVTLSGDATGSGATAITVTTTNLSTLGGSAGKVLAQAVGGVAWSNAPTLCFAGGTGNLAPTPANTTFFYQPNNSASNVLTSSTVGVTRIRVPRAGIIKNLQAEFSAAAGSGHTTTVKVYVNGSASLLSAVGSNATTATDASDLVSVSAGDRIDVMLQVSSSGTVTKATWSFEYQEY